MPDENDGPSLLELVADVFGPRREQPIEEERRIGASGSERFEPVARVRPERLSHHWIELVGAHRQPRDPSQVLLDLGRLPARTPRLHRTRRVCDPVGKPFW
jgi:hypothetical protein